MAVKLSDEGQGRRAFERHAPAALPERVGARVRPGKATASGVGVRRGVRRLAAKITRKKAANAEAQSAVLDLAMARFPRPGLIAAPKRVGGRILIDSESG